MRKQRKNEFVLMTNANHTSTPSILNFVANWLANNGMSEEKCSAVKTATCEAISNVVDHAYDVNTIAKRMSVEAYVYEDNTVKIAIRDEGKGIADIPQARASLFTTGDSIEHSGMGFTVMEAFVDTVKVRSTVNKGTSVLLFTTLE